MGAQGLAAAMQRAVTVFERRPEIGMHDDMPATASWTGGTRVVSSHANGKQMATDMPAELGGTGDQVTPGWLFRAGLAACCATSIVMVAATKGIRLSALDVRASSRSDTRGLLGMHDADGNNIPAGPQDLCLEVRIAAPEVETAALRALVEQGLRCSPIPNAVQAATPFELRIETSGA